MNDSGNQTSFSALADDGVAVVRVAGPATCRDSGRFENLLSDVEARGFRVLVLDLADCSRMDSTFAGALLRLASRASKAIESNQPMEVVVAGAKHPVSDLLDTLCLSGIFKSVPMPDLSALQDLDFDDRDLPREQIMALSLDSHERLSELNEENKRRFAMLLPILRNELARVRVLSPAPAPQAETSPMATETQTETETETETPGTETARSEAAAQK